MLQGVAVFCRALQCVAGRSNALPYSFSNLLIMFVFTSSGVFQCVAGCCRVLHCVEVCCSELQWVALFLFDFADDFFSLRRVRYCLL